jgi:fructose transport system substrate-binding protein
MTGRTIRTTWCMSAGDLCHSEHGRVFAGRRLPRLLAALALAVLTLAACGGPGGPPAQDGAADGGEEAAGVKIGLVTKTETNPYFVRLRESARAQAEEQGAELVALAGKFDGDNEGQVAAVENLIAQGVTGILITPSNASGVLGAIQAAKNQGIVVIALDSATDPPDLVDATLATDNFEAGRLQGAWVRAALGDKAPSLAMLDGTPGSSVDDARHSGFLEGFGIEEGAPEIVGTEITNGAQDKAQQAMENLLQATPGINAVYTINEPAARGAAAAIAAAGKQADIVMGSIDGSCSGVQDVKDGKVGATVMQFPQKMAEQGVDAIMEFASSETKPSGFIDTGAQLITDKPMPGLESQDTTWGAENCWG